MNQDYGQDLIRYRIERAREAFEEALLMQREDHWNACANRLYYACFYAVTAILAKEGLSSSKHTGAKALFNKHLIKTGRDRGNRLETSNVKRLLPKSLLACSETFQ